MVGREAVLSAVTEAVLVDEEARSRVASIPRVRLNLDEVVAADCRAKTILRSDVSDYAEMAFMFEDDRYPIIGVIWKACC